MSVRAGAVCRGAVEVGWSRGDLLACFPSCHRVERMCYVRTIPVVIRSRLMYRFARHPLRRATTRLTCLSTAGRHLAIRAEMD